MPELNAYVYDPDLYQEPHQAPVEPIGVWHQLKGKLKESWT